MAYESYGNSEENEILNVRIWAFLPELQAQMHCSLSSVHIEFCYLRKSRFLTLTKIHLACLRLIQSFQVIRQIKDMAICDKMRYHMTLSDHLDPSYKHKCMVNFPFVLKRPQLYMVLNSPAIPKGFFHVSPQKCGVFLKIIDALLAWSQPLYIYGFLTAFQKMYMESVRWG